MTDEVDLLKRVYERFNARDMETVLATMHEEVVWANGMEGGHVHGRDEVRKYWTRQWATVDPHVELTIAKLPRFIVILPRHSLAQENLHISGIKTST